MRLDFEAKKRQYILESSCYRNSFLGIRHEFSIKYTVSAFLFLYFHEINIAKMCYQDNEWNHNILL